jgi:hypothetical protein
MSRTAVIAAASLVLGTALSSVAASAGQYYYGGYPPYGGYAPVPCCAYPVPPIAPPPVAPPPAYYAPTRLPPPPVVNWPKGPRYYQYSGYGHATTPCYEQYVRVSDGRGGWAWGIKRGCDQN